MHPFLCRQRLRASRRDGLRLRGQRKLLRMSSASGGGGGGESMLGGISITSADLGIPLNGKVNVSWQFFYG